MADLGLQLLLFLLLLELLAVARLQPAITRHVAVIILVFAHGLQVLADARDLGRAALLRRVVNGLNPAQRRPRREEVQQHRRELVRHLGRWLLVMRASSRCGVVEKGVVSE